MFLQSLLTAPISSPVLPGRNQWVIAEFSVSFLFTYNFQSFCSHVFDFFISTRAALVRPPLLFPWITLAASWLALSLQFLFLPIYPSESFLSHSFFFFFLISSSGHFIFLPQTPVMVPTATPFHAICGEHWSAPSDHVSHPCLHFSSPLLLVFLFHRPRFSSPRSLFVRILFKVLLNSYFLCKELFLYFMNNLKIFTLHPQGVRHDARWWWDSHERDKQCCF